MNTFDTVFIGSIRVRALGLEPRTYGLKVPDEKTPKPAFDAEKTVVKNQVSTCSKNCAQQKAQHIFDQVTSDQANSEVSKGIDQANGSIEASSENGQRKGHSNATGTQNSFEFVSSQWQYLQPGIRDAILLLAKSGVGRVSG